MEGQLIVCVHDNLSQYLYDAAAFFGERLVADFPSEANKYLLATCYFRNNQAYRAYHLLQGCEQPSSRYLLALSAFQLGKLPEAQRALRPTGPDNEVPMGAAGWYWLGRISQLTNRTDDAIGQYKAALQDNPLMWPAYKELCMLDPHSVDTSTMGCTSSGGEEPVQQQQQQQQQDLPTPVLGRPLAAVAAAAAASGLFSSGMGAFAGGLGDAAATPMGPFGAVPGATPVMNPNQVAATSAAAVMPPASAFGGNAAAAGGGGERGVAPMVTPAGGLSFVTPSPAQLPSGPPPLPRALPGGAGPGRPAAHLGMDTTGGGGAGGAGAGVGGGAPPTTSSALPAHRRKFVDDGKLRKVSGRSLFSEGGGGGGGGTGTQRRGASGGGGTGARPSGAASAPSAAAGNGAGRQAGEGPSAAAAAGAAGGGGGAHHFGQRSGSVDSAGSRDNDAACPGPGPGVGGWQLEPVGCRSAAGFQAVRSLLQVLVEGYRLLCLYRCTEAVHLFRQLPVRQYDTGWVFVQIGRAYFEMVDYHRAAEAFAHARTRDPCRLEGMELYSTVLWHMKKEVDLSHLAQEATALDRLAPQAWCVMGNCFSLQREHDTALRSFTRALQLDPTFTYAYTLRGHELFANEDFEEAAKAYRQAIRLDGRHYNAWYGMGQIYLRQEKWQLAEKHFRRALDTNSRSSVLRCYLGTSLHKLGRLEEALRHLEDAISSDPKNPLARFEAANVLTSSERYDDALKQLQVLKGMIPRESSVHFQIGKICKRLGRLDDAMMYFCAALDLQPPASDVNIIKSAIEKIKIDDDKSDEEV